MKSLEQSANLISNWFKNNQIKECRVVISTDKMVQVNIGITHINNSKCEELLYRYYQDSLQTKF